MKLILLYKQRCKLKCEYKLTYTKAESGQVAASRKFGHNYNLQHDDDKGSLSFITQF